MSGIEGDFSSRFTHVITPNPHRQAIENKFNYWKDKGVFNVGELFYRGLYLDKIAELTQANNIPQVEFQQAVIAEEVMEESVVFKEQIKQSIEPEVVIASRETPIEPSSPISSFRQWRARKKFEREVLGVPSLWDRMMLDLEAVKDQDRAVFGFTSDDVGVAIQRGFNSLAHGVSRLIPKVEIKPQVYARKLSNATTSFPFIF